MDPKKLFIDERLRGVCGYCGSAPNSRDHVPSRVLLDEPFPQNLPVIEACKNCNEGFSQDEEYLACLIECVICGTTEPNSLKREKIQRILNEHPLLAAKIRESQTTDENGNLMWASEPSRIKNVILKLARGHLAHGLHVFHFEEPEYLAITPIINMAEDELIEFENIPKNVFFPEVGSRAFEAMCKDLSTNWHDWREVQAGRYRYRIEQGVDGDKVKIVLSEYLASTVIW